VPGDGQDRRLTSRASRIGPRPAILPASPSRSCVILDGEPADEPLGLPRIADGGAGKQLRGGSRVDGVGPASGGEAVAAVVG
jgi:hypothetical protein